MKKTILWLIVIAITVSMVSVFTLSGCKEGASEEGVVEEETMEEASEGEVTEEETSKEEAPAEMITLEFPHYAFGLEGPIADFWNELVAEYEEQNPNIDINGYNINYGEYHDKLQTAVAGGNPPDIMQLNPPFFAKFLQAGALFPLDDYIDVAAAVDGYSPLQTEIIPSFAEDGKTYGIITWANWFLPWYRPSVLANAGFDEFPTTIDEFEAMLAGVSQDDVFGVGEALSPGNYTEGVYLLIWWLYALGGDYAVDGVPSLNNPKVIETVTMIKDWYDSGYMPKEVDMSEKRKLMATDKLGVMVGNPNEYNICLGLNPDLTREDFQSIDWPTPEKDVCTIIQTMAASVNSEHPEEAAKFIAWWHSSENQAREALNCGFMLARTDVLTDQSFRDEFSSSQPNLAKFLDYSDYLKLMVPAELLTGNPDEVHKVWWTYMEKVIYENMDPTEAMNAAQEEALSVYK